MHLKKPEESEAKQYLLAVAAAMGATLLRSAFAPLFHDHQVFLFSNLAVLAIAIFVGFGPALLSLALSILFNVPLFISSSHSLVLTTDRVSALLSHSVVSIVVIYLAHRQRQANDQANRNAQDLVRLNAELEVRVAVRTAELREANADLAGFMNSIAHDMRQYLRGINVAAWSIIQDNRERLDQDGLDNLESLGRNAAQASLLVDGLLEFSRLGKNGLTRKQVNFSEIANGVVQRVSGEHPLLEPEIWVAPDITLEGDPQMLDLALQNLVENAFKYRGREPLKIEIGIVVQGEETVFFVHDNGIGFDMKFVDRIFEPFERLHRVSEYPGTGIGLANVRRIVEKHGGRIWAQSTPGRGATFFFTLGSVAEAGLESLVPSLAVA